MLPKNLQIIEHGNLKWIDIYSNEKFMRKAIKYLVENFKFHPLDIEDCKSVTHRSKCDRYPDYNFLILLYPTYDKKTREIIPTELDIFISTSYLITFHRENNLHVLHDFFSSCLKNETERQKFLNFPTERLLYEILRRLYDSRMPMLDHITSDIDFIEKKIFSGHEKEMVHEISITRRNITDFRKLMQPHKNVLKKLTRSLQDNPIFEIQKSDLYYDDLIDHTKEIWDALDNYKERIEALQETNESLITFKLNDIMRILTIISVITFPITLLATVFSMRTPGIPFTDNPHGFWIVTGIMFSTITFMIWHFKRKEWM